MTLLHKVNALIERCGTQQRRCDLLLQQGERRRRGLQDEITQLRTQYAATRQLMELERPQGQLDRTRLFLRQRRLAVIRRQLQDMAVREKNLSQDLAEIGRELEDIRCRRRLWQRQQEKYRHWSGRQRQQRMLRRLRQEETEIQEIITWKS
ncbi:hypothetical protein [Martelella alba]|uniref:Surface presentation of antigen gene type M protein n=1 Tax=Martelella alba TaxID=2590451 RepID=A0ABY2SJK6_9HYPH|nr:hypothetical protein [Martelella alba]TKI05082.1 hypothetical protein FCN80_15350 [Martelella alba]